MLPNSVSSVLEPKQLDRPGLLSEIDKVEVDDKEGNLGMRLLLQPIDLY